MRNKLLLLLSVISIIFLAGCTEPQDDQADENQPMGELPDTIATKECIYQLNFMGTKEFILIKDSDRFTSDNILKRELGYLQDNHYARFTLWASTGWNEPESCKRLYLQLSEFDRTAVLIKSDSLRINATQGIPIELWLNTTSMPYIILNLFEIRNATGTIQ